MKLKNLGIIAFLFLQSVAYTQDNIHLSAPEFEAGVRTTLQTYLTQMIQRSLTPQSVIFESAPTPERLAQHVKDFYSARALLPGSQISCHEMRNPVLNTLELDYARGSSNAMVDLECIGADKGYIAHKSVRLHQTNNKWFVSLDSK